ncbi:hypothetical protein EXU57_23180 [Segetibacter sp. 3557_3]|uniref:TssN family type VI secretion system protein n=1 Tax=Segetibacter sp. 3557_3 TaxID=2547429 RepID=UPI001058704E|nr:TssN family type VI secretion system protein [Segetibacter sp. 3557_3]TDH18503.1 hypothetical protein EXU57_23180 [Segetibacter sp. 3557_3]
MEKMVANELTKTLFFLGIGVAGVSALLIKIIANVRGSFRYTRITLLYLLITFVLAGGIAAISSWSPLQDQLIVFIIFQGCFLLMGIAVVKWMPEFCKTAVEGNGVWLELGLILLLAISSCIAFLIVYGFISPNGLHYDMVTSVFFFIVPWFVDQTFNSAIAIPPIIFRIWYPPEDEPMDKSQGLNVKLISFEFRKNCREQHFTNFRVKAPAALEMGTLFYLFINDYNDRHQDDPIEYMDEYGEPEGWLFYEKTKWYSIKTKYISPAKTISNNRISENDVIICKRMDKPFLN